jgi:hypothetical protein
MTYVMMHVSCYWPLDIVQSAEKSLLDVDRIFDMIIAQVESRRLELKLEIVTFKQVVYTILFLIDDRYL